MKCRQECAKAKYLTFFTGYDGGKTDYKSEWALWYNKENATANNGANDGTVDKYSNDKAATPGGCLGYSYNSGT